MKRIQRKRTKGWKMPANTVYVGRPSKWGNPFLIHPAEICNKCGQEIDSEMDAETAVRCFSHSLELRAMMPFISQLKGKNLACWCPLDQSCHADVLLKLANQD